MRNYLRSMMYYERLQNDLRQNPKRWLVTGAAGFIGSNLVETLLRLDQIVYGLDNFATGHRYNLEKIATEVTPAQWSNFLFQEGDIVDYDFCMQMCRDIDIVLHQAALGSVPRSIDDPVTSNAANVTGFLNILTASKACGVKRFVYASSSSVYGDSQELPKVESRTGKLLSPYAVTKLVDELYAEVFYKTYGIETIGLRYFNVFGKRQDPNGAYAAVMPKWIAQILHNEAVFINGDGETSRDFTYIDNVVQMNILSATTHNEAAFGKVFNTAAGGRETLNNLYEAITTQLKRRLPDLTIQKPIYKDFRPGDIRHSNADISLAKELLHYTPSHTLQEGLRESIAWYIEDLKGDDAG